MRIRALDATLADVQIKVVEPHDLNILWPDMDPM
jgi:hypothetical protein